MRVPWTHAKGGVSCSSMGDNIVSRSRSPFARSLHQRGGQARIAANLTTCQSHSKRGGVGWQVGSAVRIGCKIGRVGWQPQHAPPDMTEPCSARNDYDRPRAPSEAGGTPSGGRERSDRPERWGRTRRPGTEVGARDPLSGPQAEGTSRRVPNEDPTVEGATTVGSEPRALLPWASQRQPGPSGGRG